MERALSAVQLGVRDWHKVAADRLAWRELVSGHGEDKERSDVYAKKMSNKYKPAIDKSKSSIRDILSDSSACMSELWAP